MISLVELVEVSPVMSKWVLLEKNVYHLDTDTQQLLYFKKGNYYVQRGSLHFLTNLGAIK